jgi:hypothetical protein
MFAYVFFTIGNDSLVVSDRILNIAPVANFTEAEGEYIADYLINRDEALPWRVCCMNSPCPFDDSPSSSPLHILFGTPD